MSAHKSAITLHQLGFTWPDGDTVIDAVNGSIDRGRVGLVGRNGAGKSTLLRLIAGELVPSRGSIIRSGTVAMLPQDHRLRAHRSVIELLGIREVIDAISAIEGGCTDPSLFDAVGDDWDIESRAIAALAAAGVDIGELERSVTNLSGGEMMLTALVGLAMRRPDIALLDEPTNNLDAAGRERVAELVEGWRGTIIVASHDLGLLERMESIAELRGGELAVYGGGYSSYRSQLEAEQESAAAALRTAKQALKHEQRQRIKAEERIAHSQRQARTDAANRKYVKAVVDDRRNSAEKAQGAQRGLHDARVTTARADVDAVAARIRDDAAIALDLPDPGVPAGRRIARFVDAAGVEVVVQGPERVAITGANGVGKTTLLRTLLGEASGGRVVAEAFVSQLGSLSQHLDDLEPTLTVLENVMRTAGAGDTRALKNRMAKLLLRGSMLDRPVAALSGGERFRVALAQLLFAEPPPQLLVLDEPTNSLDLDTIDQLVTVLAAYRGALVIVSHDRALLDRLELTSELALDHDGRLTRLA